MMSLKTCRFVLMILTALGACTPAWSFSHPTAVLTIQGAASGTATGSITITVNGHTETVTYGQFSTPAAIASAFAAKFSQDPISSLPNLCTIGICAKSSGNKIVFELSDETAFDTPVISLGSSPFSVDTSLWPVTPTQSALPMSLDCSTDSVAIGDPVSCTASLPAGTPGSVQFQVDSTPWQTVGLDSNGNAIVSGALPTAAAGNHLVIASYTPSNGLMAYAYETVAIEPSTGPGTTVYSYYIQDTGGHSGYMPNGNIAAYIDSVNGTWGVNANGAGSSLGYDGLGRLISATQTVAGNAPQFTCWDYDSFGNRTVQASSNQSFSAGCQASTGATSYYATRAQFSDGSNRITGRSSVDQAGTVHAVATPAYDANGNITQDETYQYIYDASGHICAAHTAYGMIGYLYDAEGHRVAKGNISSMTCDPAAAQFQVTNTYVIGPDGDTMTEVNGGTWAKTEITVGGRQIATYDNNGVHFQLHDWLGTRRVQTNYAGIPEDLCQSHPFGDGLNCSNSALDASDKHFTGKEHDSESGLDYFGARFYASSMGRWMSPDWSDGPQAVPYSSLDNPQTLNLYGYVGNNPLSKEDADGHCAGYGVGWGGLNSGCSEMFAGEASYDGRESAVVGAAEKNQAQQQMTSGQASVSDGVKKVGGIVGTLKKWFGRGQSVEEIAQNGAEYKMWQKTQTLADQAYQKDPTSSYGYMQLMVSQLAQAHESYLVIEAGVKANGLLNGVPILGDVQSAMLPSLRQSLIVPAEQNYSDALHSWQANMASQQ